MIKIYDERNIGNNKYIRDVESTFSYYKDDIKKMPELKDVCKEIDNISVVKGAYIETPFGATSIDDLSTGCKAMLLAILLGQKSIIVSFLECGENVFNYLLKKCSNVSIYCNEIQVSKDVVDIPFVYAEKEMTMRQYLMGRN